MKDIQTNLNFKNLYFKLSLELARSFLLNNQSDEPIPMKYLIKEVEKQIILQALKVCNGNQKVAADLIKMKATTLYEKIHRFNIKPEKQIYINEFLING